MMRLPKRRRLEAAAFDAHDEDDWDEAATAAGAFDNSAVCALVSHEMCRLDAPSASRFVEQLTKRLRTIPGRLVLGGGPPRLHAEPVGGDDEAAKLGDEAAPLARLVHRLHRLRRARWASALLDDALAGLQTRRAQRPAGSTPLELGHELGDKQPVRAKGRYAESQVWRGD